MWESQQTTLQLCEMMAGPVCVEPQLPKARNVGSCGKMDKCTFCAGGPEDELTSVKFQKYG